MARRRRDIVGKNTAQKKEWTVTRMRECLTAQNCHGIEDTRTRTKLHQDHRTDKRPGSGIELIRKVTKE
jgi:hypothetical protein